MIDDACLPEPGHDGRAVVVKSMNLVSVFDGITFCLSYVVSPGLEEGTLLAQLFSRILANVLACYLKVTLPFSNLEETLACTIVPPHATRDCRLARPHVTTSFPHVSPAINDLAVFLHTINSTTDIITRPP